MCMFVCVYHRVSQTGCGKTHTMQGRESPPELRGIIPNSFDHIFDYVKATTGKEFLIRCAYLEIYNEEVRDLLGEDPLKRLELKEDPNLGVFVKDLIFKEVRLGCSAGLWVCPGLAVPDVGCGVLVVTLLTVGGHALQYEL